jgi:hypothetical protein
MKYLEKIKLCDIRKLKYIPEIMKEKTVVLIISSMRAGSTLLKSLLANAPDVSYLPEIDFQRYNKQNFWKLKIMSNKKIIVLKKPCSYLDVDSYPKIPNIPNLKKIILIRDIYDTIISLKEMHMTANKVLLETWDYGKLVKDYWCKVYRNIMNNVQLKDRNTITVKYEDLIETPIKTSKRIFGFIGSSQRDGVDTYFSPQEYRWEWGIDDGGEKIKTLKIQNYSRNRDDKELLKVIESSDEAFEIRKYFGYTR